MGYVYTTQYKNNINLIKNIKNINGYNIYSIHSKMASNFNRFDFINEFKKQIFLTTELYKQLEREEVYSNEVDFIDKSKTRLELMFQVETLYEEYCNREEDKKISLKKLNQALNQLEHFSS